MHCISRGHPSRTAAPFAVRSATSRPTGLPGPRSRKTVQVEKKVVDFGSRGLYNQPIYRRHLVELLFGESAMECTRVTPPRAFFRLPGGYLTVRCLLGTLLLLAAVLKLRGLTADPVARMGVFSTSEFQVAIIQYVPCWDSGATGHAVREPVLCPTLFVWGVCFPATEEVPFWKADEGACQVQCHRPSRIAAADIRK